MEKKKAFKSQQMGTAIKYLSIESFIALYLATRDFLALECHQFSYKMPCFIVDTI